MNDQATERARADRDFVQQLCDLANAMTDVNDPVLAWVGAKVGELADRARFLDATSADDYDYKAQVMLDHAPAGVFGRESR